MSADAAQHVRSCIVELGNWHRALVLHVYELAKSDPFQCTPTAPVVLAAEKPHQMKPFAGRDQRFDEQAETEEVTRIVP
ncbi:MAG: hypothetical protein JXO22_05815, partial [Phycisphaerae bacterium]|nr:hypothetical protein [Phycisphaerae bacterium]